MPQRHLPFFPDGVEPITAELAFEKKAGQITYFNGHMPVFIHDEQDIVRIPVKLNTCRSEATRDV